MNNPKFQTGIDIQYLAFDGHTYSGRITELRLSIVLHKYVYTVCSPEGVVDQIDEDAIIKVFIDLGELVAI